MRTRGSHWLPSATPLTHWPGQRARHYNVGAGGCPVPGQTPPYTCTVAHWSADDAGAAGDSAGASVGVSVGVCVGVSVGVGVSIVSTVVVVVVATGSVVVGSSDVVVVVSGAGVVISATGGGASAARWQWLVRAGARTNT
jgi:hypothetical protein